MSWQAFKAKIARGGLSRTNRYRVIIPFPTTDSSGVELAELFCESVSLPEVNISTTRSLIFGESREMPYEKTYGSMQLSFYVDAQMTIKTAFDRWIGLVINPDRRTVQYYNQYTRPIDIFIATVGDETPYKVTLYEAYPKLVGPIALSAESREVMKLPVTMQYKYWKAESTTISATQIVAPSAISLSPQGVFVGPQFPPSSNILP